jgi:hypothetical protein
MHDIADNSVDVNGEPSRWASERQGVDAVVVRIGLNGAQLVLVDGEGEWERWVYGSVNEASTVASSLEIDVSTGEYPEAVRIRMNRYRRPPANFRRAAYPEQGRVGPIIPYPENRPRQVGSGPDEPRSPRSPEDGGP